MAEVEGTTLSGLLTPDFTTVYVGAFNVVDYELSLAFSADYTYNGGNLLVQVELTKTASNYPASSFLGVVSDGSGWIKYQTYGSGSAVNFLPKATFTYEAGAPVTCDKPLDIIINDADIEPTGVMLTLAGINNATIEIKRSADTEWTVKETEFNGPSWGIGTLEPNTSYDVRVKNVCGGTDGESKYVTASFKTPCGPINGLDTYGFEDVTAGYGAYNIPECWEKVAYDVYPYVYGYNSGVGGTGNCLRFSGGVKDYSEQAIILPEFIPSLTTLTVSFYHKETKDEIWYGTEYKYGKLEVGYYFGGEFTRVGDALDQEEDNFVLAEVALTGDIPTGARIAIRYAGGEDGGRADIDDIRVFETPSCAKPINVEATYIAYNGVTFNWEASGSENRFEFALVTPGTPINAWNLLDEDEFEVTIGGLLAGTTYEFNVRSYCDASNQSDAVMVSFSTLTIPTPTEVTVSNVTSTSATISWTAVADITTYQYCVVNKDAGEDWSDPISSVDDVTVDLSGLTANTPYDVYVRANLGESNSAAAKVSFVTPCEAITSALTWTEDFEGSTEYELPNCWEAVYDLPTDPYKPTIQTRAVADYVHQGTKSLYMSAYVYEEDGYGFAVLPEFDDADISKLQLKFWHKEQSVESTLDLGYLTDVNNIATFTVLLDCTESTDWTEETADLATLPDGARLAFRYTYVGEGYSKYAVGIDDISFEEKPVPCAVPTNVSVSATHNSAEITWEDAEGTQWDIEWKRVGETESYHAVQYDYDGLKVIFVVAANTEYVVRVARIAPCESEYTDWVEFVTPETPTAVENTTNSKAAIKRIENGQIIIIRDGVRYNVIGTKVE